LIQTDKQINSCKKLLTKIEISGVKWGNVDIFYLFLDF